MQNKKPVSDEAKLMATIFMWSILILVVGSVLGVWVKFFWLGWVFAGCVP